jgi:hypothetical protein
VLGSTEVQWRTETLNGKEASGFHYNFTDYVFKGYAGQDNVQVAAAADIMVQQVKERNPSVKSVIFQSDNASCLHHRN